MLNAPSDSPATVENLKLRDHGAFSKLVQQYHPAMLAVARSIAGEWADEIVQEAWVSIYKALPGFQGRSTLKTWIFSIVKNEARTRLRKESRTISLDTSATGGQAATDSWLNNNFNSDGSWSTPPENWNINSPDALLQEEELRHCIEHTLSVLQEDQKAVFVLRDLQQTSFEEICNILDLSNSNVRVLLHRARLTLMKVIDRYQKTGQC